MSPGKAGTAKVVAVVGPTASGKTELALALARALGGEMVCADSRQLYRGLDAGTAKPERDAAGRSGGVPCHLFDAAGIDESFDAGRFSREAWRLCEDILSRGRLPVLCGGTGLYLKALLEGLSELPPADAGVRARLLDEARREGRAGLHARLTRFDPGAAARIPAGNIQRVVRALEVLELTGTPISEHWARAPRSPGLPALVLRVDWPAAALSRRIEARSRAMWPGMLAEARALLARGARGDEPGLQSLGYREALACARGELSAAQGLAALERATLLYAKRQRTWFARQLPALSVPGGPVEEMLAASLRLAEGRLPA